MGIHMRGKWVRDSKVQWRCYRHVARPVWVFDHPLTTYLAQVRALVSWSTPHLSSRTTTRTKTSTAHHPRPQLHNPAPSGDMLLLAASSSMFPVIGHWNSATAQRTLLERPTNSCCAFRLVISPHDFVTRERRRAHNVELEHRSHTAPQLLTAHPAQHDLLQWCHVEAEHLHQEVRAPAMRSILQPWHTGTCCSGSVQNPPRAAMERHARWWSVDSIHVNVTAPLHNIAQCAPYQHTLRAHPTRTHSTARRNTAL